MLVVIIHHASKRPLILSWITQSKIHRFLYFLVHEILEKFATSVFVFVHYTWKNVVTLPHEMQNLFTWSSLPKIGHLWKQPVNILWSNLYFSQAVSQELCELFKVTVVCVATPIQLFWHYCIIHHAVLAFRQFLNKWLIFHFQDGIYLRYLRFLKFQTFNGRVDG